jgi:hypothetical protein
VVQPTFLYELIWNVLVFVALIYIDRRFRLGHGRLFAVYVAAYCIGRFCVELLRDDTATHIAGIRINSFTSTFVFIGAVVYLMAAPKGREDPESLRGNDCVDEEEPAPDPEATVAEDTEAPEVEEAEEPEAEDAEAPEVGEAEEPAAEDEPGVDEEQAEQPDEPEVVEEETSPADDDEATRRRWGRRRKVR